MLALCLVYGSYCLGVRCKARVFLERGMEGFLFSFLYRGIADTGATAACITTFCHVFFSFLDRYIGLGMGSLSVCSHLDLSS